MAEDILVAGLGNPLMADEGIGIAVIDRLLAYADDFADVEFADAGTGGITLLHRIAGRRKVIFVDCALMGKKPGTIVKFTPQQVQSVKKLSHQSLHEADLLNIIRMSRELDQCPPEIIIFGIEPEIIELSQGLSKTLAENLDRYVELVSQELTASD